MTNDAIDVFFKKTADRRNNTLKSITEKKLFAKKC